MKKLLLVIDMVNGFVKEGALADKEINNITPNIINLIKEYVQEGNDIISIQEGHNENSKEFENFPKHCILGTEEADLIEELKPYENKFAKPLKNYINENDLDMEVVIYKDAVETYDAPNHNRKEYNEIAFKIMEQNGIKIIKEA